MFARPKLLVNGVSCQGMARVHPQKNGTIRAALFFTEELLGNLLIHVKPQMEWTDDEYWRAWGASHIVRHECAHVLQHGAFADLYKKYFAPHGLHEQKQFANALAAALGSRFQWGTYHPPTCRQMQVLKAHLAYRTQNRLARPRRIVYPLKGSWTEGAMRFFEPMTACTFCSDPTMDAAA